MPIFWCAPPQSCPPTCPVQLRIAGVGQDAGFASRMEAAARKDPRIQLMGLVKHEKVPEFLADIDVLAVPSRYTETGPIVVQEARALGIPVMGADLGGISERVRHGVDGWLLPFDDPKPWAEAIRGGRHRPRRGRAAVEQHATHEVDRRRCGRHGEILLRDHGRAIAGGRGAALGCPSAHLSISSPKSPTWSRWTPFDRYPRRMVRWALRGPK